MFKSCLIAAFFMLEFMRLLRDNILVRPIERKLSAIIETLNSETYNQGIVESVGRDCQTVRVGDTVHYTQFAYHPNIEGNIMITERDVCCICTDRAKTN